MKIITCMISYVILIVKMNSMDDDTHLECRNARKPLVKDFGRSAYGREK